MERQQVKTVRMILLGAVLARAPRPLSCGELHVLLAACGQKQCRRTTLRDLQLYGRLKAVEVTRRPGKAPLYRWLGIPLPAFDEVLGADWGGAKRAG